MPVRHPLARAARPTLIVSTALAAIAVIPGAALAAPFEATSSGFCSYAPKDSPANTTGTTFNLPITIRGEATTLTEGEYFQLRSGSLVLGSNTSTGLGSLAALGDTVALSLTKADIPTQGANRALTAFVSRWSPTGLGTITSTTKTLTAAAMEPQRTGVRAPIAIGSKVTLFQPVVVGEITATTGPSTTVYRFSCPGIPAPPIAPTPIAELTVAPKAVPAPPEIVGLNARGRGPEGLEVQGRFDGPITSVFIDDVPLQFTKRSYNTIAIEQIPDTISVGRGSIRVVTPAGETANTAADDFDVTRYTPAGNAVTVQNVCTLTGNPTATVKRTVTTKLRGSLPTSVRTGDALSIDPIVSITFPGSTLSDYDSIGAITQLTAGIEGLRLGATGTSSSDVVLAESGTLSSGFPLLGRSVDLAFDAPHRSVSLGTVTAPAGSRVVLKPAGFRLKGTLTGNDPLDGLGLIGDYDWTCLPSGDLAGGFASIPVVDDANPEPTPTPTPTPTVTPSPTPVADPTPTPTPTPIVTPTPSPTPKPDGDTTFVKYPFNLKGSATLKTLTKGTLPLTGSIDATLGLPSQTFTATLALNPTSGKLTTLGFLPVDAKVNLVSTEPVKGSLKDGVLLANAKVRIKLPSVKTLGIELAGGANCQAKQISSINLRSTQEEFLPTEGGPIAGTFSISDLTGCGFLNNLVSPLTAGSGNAIALNLINP